MKYNAVIFDLDGTLLNTLADLRDSVNYALAQCGFAPRSLEEIRCFVGNGTKRLVKLSVPEGTAESEFESCYELFKAHYAHNYRNKTAPYDGVCDLLSEIGKMGVKIAVVSNKPDAQTKLLCEENFAPFVEAAFGARDGIALKPSSDIVRLALEHLGVSENEAIFVGDSEVDAATAHNSRLPFVGVTWGFRPREVLRDNNAEFIIEKPRELLEIIV